MVVLQLLLGSCLDLTTSMNNLHIFSVKNDLNRGFYIHTI